LISTTLLDLNWTGYPRSIAAALLRSGEQNSLIDPGPTSTISTLRQQLSMQGLLFADIHYIFLTHIHLDHAGVTGALVRENPDIKVFVHSRGAPHIVDPAALLKSAYRLYGENMNQLFGEFLPVPAANLHVLNGSENLPVGSNSLHVLYTPGHASHHVTYFDERGGTAFVGDTAGICIEGHPFVLPAAPPPDIDMALWNCSLDAIKQLSAQRLFLTHFGFSNQPAHHLDNYRLRLQQWSEIAASILATGLEDSLAMEEFVRQVSVEIEQRLLPEESRQYRYNGHLPLSWMGLSRYHRKRSGAPKS
jgi:glyoxylase-like metal-dependent hydrolase (beta-lactamase superfamily II)